MPSEPSDFSFLGLFEYSAECVAVYSVDARGYAEDFLQKLPVIFRRPHVGFVGDGVSEKCDALGFPLAVDFRLRGGGVRGGRRGGEQREGERGGDRGKIEFFCGKHSGHLRAPRGVRQFFSPKFRPPGLFVGAFGKFRGFWRGNFN